MALRVLGHPEDGARFRTVEILHVHPASLARGTRHDPCASAPSSPNTIFSPSGLPRPVPGPGPKAGSRKAEGEPTFPRRLAPTRPPIPSLRGPRCTEPPPSPTPNPGITRPSYAP